VSRPRIAPAVRRCACAAALLSVACRAPAPAPRPRPADSVDLLTRFPDADCLSDRLDLPFLLSRSLLKHHGFEEGRDPAARTSWLWLSEADGRLELPLATTGPKTLRFTARCKVSQRPQLPVVISLNGRVLATLAITPDETQHTVEFPPEAQVAGRNELRFEARPRAERPRRPLMVTRLEIGPAGGAGGAAPTLAADGLLLPSGASVRYPVDPARPGTELEIGLQAGPAGGGRVRIALLGNGGEHELADLAAGSAPATTIMPLPVGPVTRLALSSTGTTSIRALRLRLPPSPASPPVSAAVRVPARPSLVLFVADAVRADVLSAYGHPLPTSPRFDAFAQGGWLFEDATAQSSWTRPSVASLLTGLGVDAHGIFGVRNTIVPAMTTLPEALRAAGYATAAFVANDVVSPGLGYAQGFDAWTALPRRPSAEVVRAALAWTRERAGPFFVYVHTLGAHRPYGPSPEHWKPFRPAVLPRRGDVNALVLQPHLAADEMALVRSAYAAEVHEDDAAFGELLDGIDAQGLRERTAVLFTADHGEGFDEHGDRGHGIRLYQETAHVPLALRVPGTAAGARVAVPVQHADIAPTFLALAGLPPPPELRGSDLARLGPASRRTEPTRVLVSRVTYAGADKVAVRWGSWKLIANEEPDTARADRFELYDLARDPAEGADLSESRPEVVEYLWMESRALRAAEEAFRLRLGGGRKVDLSPADREALRALGYVE
jgi:arylsulfatase A-like enzyme